VKPSELLKHYIFLHNFGVEMGDFEPLMALFTDNAIFAFENPRIGEFEGIEMIRGIFRRQPPTINVVIGEIAESGNSARADYALEEKPENRQGFISLDIEDNKIKKLFIGL
jgi:hypothetical protein